MKKTISGGSNIVMSSTPAETKLEDRWRTIRKVNKERRLIIRLAGALLVLVVGVGIGSLIFTDQNYQVNIYSELLSIGVTVAILDTLNRYRDEQRSERALKEQLIQMIANQDSKSAHIALRQIRDRGWLTGNSSILKGANLFRAELQSADLWGANLENAILDSANLLGVSLRQANLRNADLRRSNLNDTHMEAVILEGANMDSAFLCRAGLWRADLRNAHLWAANLEGAHLWFADLRGAYLMYANLDGVRLKDTVFDETTILPDGEKWTHLIDLTRYGAILEDDNLTR